MHYYKKNIGDYAKKAGRLSMLQHGAYTLLIDACYDRERFPTLEDAVDWAWASSSDEIDAVKFVLKKFFTLNGDIYVQDRIKQELDNYRKNAETNKRIAVERETKRKEKRTERDKDSTKRERSVNEAAPNHKPLTINQEPIKEKDKKKISFSRPSENDINNFAVENNFNLDGMFDFYESNGWKVGRNAMKDWKATARNWNRRNNNGTRSKQAISGQLTGAAKQSAEFHEDLKKFAARVDGKAVQQDADILHAQMDKLISNQ